MKSKGGNQPINQPQSNEGQLYVSNLSEKAERSEFLPNSILNFLKEILTWIEQLKDYFNSFGTMTECRMIKDKATSKYSRNIIKIGSDFYFQILFKIAFFNSEIEKFRGFAFITYADPVIAQQVLEQTHVLFGKKVQLKKAATKDSTRKKVQDDKQKKLFITGISKKLKNSEVKKYFGCFGKVKDVKLMPSKSGKGMGFVVFAESGSVAKVIEHSSVHKIAKHKVRILPSYSMLTVFRLKSEDHSYRKSRRKVVN